MPRSAQYDVVRRILWIIEDREVHSFLHVAREVLSPTLHHAALRIREFASNLRFLAREDSSVRPTANERNFGTAKGTVGEIHSTISPHSNGDRVGMGPNAAARLYISW
jgi:hypothetical protein